MSNLSNEKRDRLIEILAERWTEAQSMRDLEQFFYNVQVEYLEELTDDELMNLATEFNIVED